MVHLLLHFTPAFRSSPSIPASCLCCSPLLATSRYCCVRAVIASAPPTSRGPCFASSTQTLIPSCRASSADRRPVGPAEEVSTAWVYGNSLVSWYSPKSMEERCLLTSNYNQVVLFDGFGHVRVRPIGMNAIAETLRNSHGCSEDNKRMNWWPSKCLGESSKGG